MGDYEGSTQGPIDLPASTIYPVVARRRHRSLTGTAGILLFVCMFLPAVKGCGEPVVPLEMPAFWHPYIYGLAFAAIALARTARAVLLGVIALRALATLIMLAATVMLAFNPAIGVVQGVLGVMLLATVGVDGASERRLAATAVMVGGVSAAWFALWCASPDALLGVYLSLGSALGLFVGGLVWAAELALRPPGALPQAVIRYGR